jgi:hypothetical protein
MLKTAKVLGITFPETLLATGSASWLKKWN